MTAMTSLVFATLLASASAAPLKLGGVLKTSYQTPFTKWVEWANSGSNGNYTVTSSIETYVNDTTMQASITAMTTPGNAKEVHAVVCPYTSGKTSLCVKAVNPAYTGPVFAWGGASDSIFTTDCAALTNKNCFGFFTIASEYTKTGITALASKATAGALKVVLMTNNNGFSASVATGTKATLAAHSSKFTIVKEVTFAGKGSFTAADTTKVNDAMTHNPDVVIISGHNKDVEPAIVAIGKHSNMPKAILATNSVNAVANYGADSKYAKCVMMPTQYDESSTAADPVVGWTVSAFKTAMGGSATYQQAAAGAVGVALANAMTAAANDPTKLKEKLAVMDVTSFYGQLKWNADGSIVKPMYTVQGTSKVLVAPTGTPKYPLSDAQCWGAAGGSSTSGAATSGGATSGAAAAASGSAAASSGGSSGSTTSGTASNGTSTNTTAAPTAATAAATTGTGSDITSKSEPMASFSFFLLALPLAFAGTR